MNADSQLFRKRMHQLNTMMRDQGRNILGFRVKSYSKSCLQPGDPDQFQTPPESMWCPKRTLQCTSQGNPPRPIEHMMILTEPLQHRIPVNYTGSLSYEDCRATVGLLGHSAVLGVT